ncbi:uncharacterized protein N7515_004863 [Penicillium bovifimosum]|uniref:Uncharacterized protein n=1 Tax=Penicillium bovifimosum TaxID=126998 RepID=A0A9W9L2U2_9EURO|nr:uncharacterized protein N7515_004863 [Penicillium bovifimosum]KAJ5135585.1 hypothetical protein N7515_004863 [Penicillium bovifimosum]
MSFDINNRVSERQASPFRRASTFDRDIHAKLPSPPQDDVPHPRHAIRPRSLADAYRDASKHTMAPTYDDDYNYVTTPSPRSRQTINAFSPVSPPPQELEDAYKRIDEDNALAHLVPDNDWESQRSTSRSRPSPSRRDTNSGRGSANGHFSGAEFGDELGEVQPRTGRDYTKDEERLKRVTGQRSPVFSRAQVGRDVLTADNLRRRMEDKTEAEHSSPEDDRNGVPSPNIPTGWGHRAGHRQEWERRPVQRSYSAEQQERRWSPSSAELEETQANRSTRPRPRSALEERADSHVQPTENSNDEQPGSKRTSPVIGGEPIPNSPITVYKNSSIQRPSTSKRDSRDLLRKLSRTENPKPDQVQTPEPPKLFQRQIYDKTPRVTGAWVDTPMTQRVAEKVELPEDLTRDIVHPPTNQEPKDVAPAKPNDETNTEEPKPAQTTEKNHPPAPIPERHSRAPLPRPHLPKSALETVIEDASSGKDVEFGEDTIESLQAIMENGPIETKVEEEDDKAYEAAVLAELEKDISTGNKEVDLDSLNLKLNSLTRHIDEVKKGLNGLETYITRGAAIVSQGKSPKENLHQAHFHTADTCKGCAVHSDGRVYAAIPLPRLWTRSPRSQRLRPTTLAWFLVLAFSWYIIECLMWDRYSHPEISESCEGYCLQPDAPVFPWVTATMLWRWSHLSILVTPVWAIGLAFSRLVAQLVGLSDGYVDDATELGNIFGEIRINGTPVAFPWLSAPTAEINVPRSQQPVYTQQAAQPQPVPPQMWATGQISTDEAMDSDEFL